MVQSVDWTSATGRGVLYVLTDLNSDGGLTHRHQRPAMFVNDSESQQLEVSLMRAAQFVNQQFKTGLRSFELVALMLQALQLIEHRLFVSQFQFQLARFRQ